MQAKLVKKKVFTYVEPTPQEKEIKKLQFEVKNLKYHLLRVYEELDTLKNK